MSDVTVSIEPVERHVDWMADATEIRFESERTRGIGTTFLCDTRIGPIKLTDRMEITEWTPAVDAADGVAGIDGVMGVVHSGVVTGRGVFTIEPLASGRRTKFTWNEDLEFPWYFGGRLGEIIAGRFVLRFVWNRNLTALKAIVDAR